MNKRTMLITMLCLIFMIGFVSAAQPLPHAFEGKIISEDSTSTNMKTLTARINGITTATTKIQNDSYSITVVDNTGTGGNIEFFIGDEKASEEFSFSSFEITKTNLTFKTIPDETIGSCGDGICAVEECSFCAIDCPVAKCLNNNVCDTAIGEDIVTAPSDCKAPESPSTSGSSSGGGSSGGSSGSGGSVSSKATEIVKPEHEETKETKPVVSIDSLNEAEKEKSTLETTKRKGFFGITGYSILNNKNGKPRTAITIIGLILIGGIFFITRKKLSKLKSKSKK